MQPRKLSMKNFGPFANEQLDFGDFQEAGLFLISGKTGAGKTTIFDGMTFALFGETSGNLRSGKEMRSTFAASKEETVVQFSFEHQHLLYEIERRPEQMLAKKRGDGLTTQPMKVCLTIYDQAGNEQQQLTKKNEVDSFIKELLQLDAKQFFQTIMLPQGEFRNFLIASSGQKEKVLRNLFGTEIYQRFNEWLKKQVKAKQKSLDTQLLEAENLKQRFRWQKEQSTVTFAETLTLWKEDLKLIQEKITLKEDEMEKLLQQKSEQQTQLFAAKKVNQAFLEREELLQKQQELTEQNEAIEQLNKKFSELNWLSEHQELLTQYDQRKAELTSLTSRLESVQKEKRMWQQKQQEWEKQREAISELAEKARQTEAKLQEQKRLQPIAKLYQEQEEFVADYEQEVAKKQKQLNELTAKKEQLQKEEQSLSKVLAQEVRVQVEELQLLKCQQLLEKWQETGQQRKQLLQQENSYQEQLTSEKSQVKQLQEEQQTLQKQLQVQKSTNAKLQIARLSLLLVEGEPCPVCGSLDHPLKHQEVSAEELQQSEQAVEQTEQKLHENLQKNAAALEKMEQLQHLFSKTRQQVVQKETDQKQQYDQLADKLQELLKEKLTPENIQELFSEYCLWHEQQKEQLRQAKLQKEAVKSSLLEKQAAEDTLKNELAEKMNEWQSARGKFLSLKDQLSGQNCDEINETVSQLEKMQEKQRQQLQEDQALQQSLREEELLLTEQEKSLQQFLKENEQAWQKAQDRLASALAKADQSISYMRSLLPELSKKQQIAEYIAKFNEESVFVDKKIAELNAVLAEKNKVDIQELEAQCEQLEDFVLQKQEELFQLKESCRQNQQLHEELQQLYQKNTEQLMETSRLQQLAETVNGENVKKTSLERYVLQTFLAEILEVANVRLNRLTRGRYQFELADSIGSYRSTTGLEINIYDDNAGSSRRAHTLSGGESFIAALALALSLADVIQTQAGGIVIEALFIDEGFGSLDEDSLEMAMEALEMIENEGRMIGIISHVRELKERIFQQVLVVTNGYGQSKIHTTNR